MKFEDEKELETTIIDMFNEDGCCPVTGHGHALMRRQFKIGTYGIVDLVGVTVNYELNGEGSVEIFLYELKLNEINNLALAQLSKYVRGLKKILDSSYGCYQSADGNIYKNVGRRKFLVDIQGVLVGSSLDHREKYFSGYTIDNMDDVEAYSYKISRDGVSFHSETGWFISDSENDKLNGIDDIFKELLWNTVKDEIAITRLQRGRS